MWSALLRGLFSNPVVECEILRLSLNSLHITTICNFNYLKERLAKSFSI